MCLAERQHSLDHRTCVHCAIFGARLRGRHVLPGQEEKDAELEDGQVTKSARTCIYYLAPFGDHLMKLEPDRED